MSKVAHVVEGEASESETEVEPATSAHDTPTSEQFVISGEAPESDDETRVENPRIPVHQAPEPPSLQQTLTRTYNSLLHQRLWECNIGLKGNLDGLLKHTTNISIERLSKCDKTLLDVQESMRSINSNLTLARARLKQIHTGLENANCASALPTVLIKQ